MEEGGPPSGTHLEAVDDRHPGAREGLERRVEVVDVDREMMQSLAAAGEEAGQEAVGTVALHELEPVVADAQLRELEGAVVSGMGLDLDRCDEIALVVVRRR